MHNCIAAVVSCYIAIMFSWFERATMTVILINCITLGMYQPCEDTSICDQKCKMLKVCNDSSYLKPISRCFYYCWWFINAYICNESFQIIDDVIYVYFVAEMLIKMVSIKDAFFVEFWVLSLLQIALGVVGKGCYLQETWNKLDCFIVVSG